MSIAYSGWYSLVGAWKVSAFVCSIIPPDGTVMFSFHGYPFARRFGLVLVKEKLIAVSGSPSIKRIETDSPVACRVEGGF